MTFRRRMEEMQVPVFLMSDLANVDGGGKLNIVGVFSTLNAPDLPFTLPSMYLVLQMAFPPNEVGTERVLKLDLIDQDGGLVFQVGPIKFNIAALVPGSQVEIPLVVNVTDLTITKPGPHKWCVLIDNDTKAGLTLNVNVAEDKGGKK